MIDLEGEIKTCTARIWAMEHPEEHSELKKKSYRNRQGFTLDQKRVELYKRIREDANFED